MYLVYTFLLYAALIAMLPWYALRFRRYLPTLRDRLGYLELPVLKRSIWVHAVSVGEVKAVQKLLRRLQDSHRGQPLVLSTITPTGQELAKGLRVADHVFFFPLDLPGAIRRTLDRINPELVVIAETEIWPNFLRECRRRGIRVVMVNGRISDRSYPRYRMIRRWLRRVLDDYTLLGMQTEGDRERIESIGADKGKVTVFGNLKYDALDTERPPAAELAEFLNTRRALWIAASTMPGEEELILDGFEQLRQRHAVTLLVAPRHPERFDLVERTIASRGYRCSRRTNPQADADVLLLDSVGELASAFRYADVVFMGGTLAPRGGHNILEPAAFAKPIVFGPHMENFREIRDLFLREQAAIEVHSGGDLADAIDQFLASPSVAAETGARAKKLVERNTGATERVMAYLR